MAFVSQYDNAPAGRSVVATRFDRVVGELEARGLAVVNRMVYDDDGGDGTGILGWLWIQTEPRCFPDEKFDVTLTYSEAEEAWSRVVAAAGVGFVGATFVAGGAALRPDGGVGWVPSGG